MARRVFAAVTLCVALVAACSSPGGDGGPGGTPPGGSIRARNAASALPDTDPAAFRRLIDQLEGTPVLVNVWGSWCPPCRREAPALARAAEEHGDRVQFIGLDILDDRESARAFMREYGWDYPSLFDVDASIRDDWGRVGQPITRLYDASGVVVWERVGEITLEMLERELERVL